MLRAKIVPEACLIAQYPTMIGYIPRNTGNPAANVATIAALFSSKYESTKTNVTSIIQIWRYILSILSPLGKTVFLTLNSFEIIQMLYPRVWTASTKANKIVLIKVTIPNPLLWGIHKAAIPKPKFRAESKPDNPQAANLAFRQPDSLKLENEFKIIAFCANTKSTRKASRNIVGVSSFGYISFQYALCPKYCCEHLCATRHDITSDTPI